VNALSRFQAATMHRIVAPNRRHCIVCAMSNRELVIDLVRRLPEDTPLKQIAREVELLAGIKTAREQAQRGEGVSVEAARKLVDSWTAR
jgi:hypothetical protein